MASRKLRKGRGLHSHRYFGVWQTQEKTWRPHSPQCHARAHGATRTHVLQAPQLLPVYLFNVCLSHCFICFLLFPLMFLSAWFWSVSVCLFLSHQMSGWRQGPSPGRVGGVDFGLGRALDAGPRLITAGFLQGQDWVMVSLLRPQSDVTLPGPCQAEGEPQGDFMQAPGLPGSRPSECKYLALAWAEAKTRGPHDSRWAITPNPLGPPCFRLMLSPQQTSTQGLPDPEVLRPGPLLVPLVWDFLRAGCASVLLEVQSVHPYQIEASKGRLGLLLHRGSPELSHRPLPRTEAGWIQPPLRLSSTSVHPEACRLQLFVFCA